MRTPDNTRLDGTRATITELTSWGAHCNAPAAATGRYRAGWVEMEPISKPNGEVEYTGGCCAVCGSVRLRRAGACAVCEDCGESNGCS